MKSRIHIFSFCLASLSLFAACDTSNVQIQSDADSKTDPKDPPPPPHNDFNPNIADTTLQLALGPIGSGNTVININYIDRYNGNLPRHELEGLCSPAGALVEAFINEEKIGERSCSGTWKFTEFNPNLLPEGQNHFRVQASHNGQILNREINLLKDTIGPIKEFVRNQFTVVDNFNSAQVPFAGYCYPDTSSITILAQFPTNLPGASTISKNTVECVDGIFFDTLNLSGLANSVDPADFPYTALRLRVQASDTAGNSFNEAQSNLTLDISPPVSVSGNNISIAALAIDPVQALNRFSNSIHPNIHLFGICPEVGQSVDYEIEDTNISGTVTCEPIALFGGFVGWIAEVFIGDLADGIYVLRAEAMDGGSLDVTRQQIQLKGTLPSIDSLSSEYDPETGLTTLSGSCSPILNIVDIYSPSGDRLHRAVCRQSGFQADLDLSELPSGPQQLDLSIVDLFENFFETPIVVQN